MARSRERRVPPVRQEALYDGENIMYIMSSSHRPANLPVRYEDRFNRWCLDLFYDNFFVFSVTGEQNLFNDFHYSRGGSPATKRFYPLEEHAADLERSLVELGESVERYVTTLDPNKNSTNTTSGGYSTAGPATDDLSAVVGSKTGGFSC